MVSTENSLYVKSGSATEYRQFVPAANIVIGEVEVALIFIQVIFISRFTDVYKVIGDCVPVYGVFVYVFPCADIHVPIYLSRVGTDDFSL